MSSGIFGSIRPARIVPSNDVDMFYYYRPTRSTEDSNFNDGYKKLDASECLVPAIAEDGSRVDGIYDLRLPLDKFGRKGFYSVYLRPKEIEATILDVSVLASYPDVRGIVFNADAIGISDLTGYRIDFIEQGSSVLVKSCNMCEPVSVTTSDGYPRSVRYNITDTSSSYIFCTVTPSSSASFRPGIYPYIGTVGTQVTISNTKFSPKLIEVEMVEHDADTITYMLEGDQVRDRDHDIITTYNDYNEIYHQADYYTIKSKLGEPLYDVKRKRDNIDSSQSYDNIMSI